MSRASAASWPTAADLCIAASRQLSEVQRSSKSSSAGPWRTVHPKQTDSQHAETWEHPATWFRQLVKTSAAQSFGVDGGDGRQST
jgi:hypothetical protein